MFGSKMTAKKIQANRSDVCGVCRHPIAIGDTIASPTAGAHAGRWYCETCGNACQEAASVPLDIVCRNTWILDAMRPALLRRAKIDPTTPVDGFYDESGRWHVIDPVTSESRRVAGLGISGV